jgi:hypothetical protein
MENINSDLIQSSFPFGLLTGSIAASNRCALKQKSKENEQIAKI